VGYLFKSTRWIYFTLLQLAVSWIVCRLTNRSPFYLDTNVLFYVVILFFRSPGARRNSPLLCPQSLRVRARYFKTAGSLREFVFTEWFDRALQRSRTCLHNSPHSTTVSGCFTPLLVDRRGKSDPTGRPLGRCPFGQTGRGRPCTMASCE
jgi:hypothetical protein